MSSKHFVFRFASFLALCLAWGSVQAAVGWNAGPQLLTARANHTQSLLHDGRILAVGGRFTSGFSTTTRASAEIFDPTTGRWTAAAPLATARSRHSATVLHSGKVLVVGGSTASSTLASAELYDPVANTWSSAGSLSVARSEHTATLMQSTSGNGLHGKVVVIGGYDAATVTTAVTEQYDPATNSWSTIGSLIEARVNHTATLMLDNTVWVIGGYKDATTPNGLATVERLSTPSGGGAATFASVLYTSASPRQLHSTTRLANGNLLVAGGVGAANASLNSALLLTRTGDTSATVTNVGNMVSARRGPIASLLPDGDVLLMGGENAADSSERFDTGTNSWQSLGSNSAIDLNQPATVMQNGHVMISGGGNGQTQVGVFNPFASTLAFMLTDALQTTSRSQHTLSMLTSGRVLAVGGRNAAGVVASPAYPDTNNAVTPLAVPRTQHAAVVLLNGRPFVAGGANAAGASLSSTEMYDSATDSWKTMAAMAQARARHTATLLGNARVLVVGGDDASPVDSVELFDPAVNAWSTMASLPGARTRHTATLLNDGRVLVVGGELTLGASTNTAVIYNPATDAWTAAASMGSARAFHSATLMPNGRVLVLGGGTLSAPATVTGEIYDPFANTWTALANNMAGPRVQHTATLLRDGRVLVAGGYQAPGTLTSVQVFDPALLTWSSGGDLSYARAEHAAILLTDGRVLIVGGVKAATSDYTTRTEVFDPQPTLDTARRPSLVGPADFDSVTNPAAALTMTGTNLVRLEEASGGNDKASASNHAFVQIRSFGGGPIRQIAINRSATNRATQLNSVAGALSGFPVGLALVTAHLNGVASAAAVLRVGAVVAPDFVRNVALVAAYKSVSVSFLPPTWNGGSAVTSYTATCNGVSVTGTASPITVTGLSSSAPITCTVVATNAAGDSLASDPTAAVFSVTPSAWKRIAGPPPSDTSQFAATLLGDGRVLTITGRATLPSQLLAPQRGTWTALSNTTLLRFWHTMTRLPSGRVLIAGGGNDGGESSIGVNTADLFDPTTNTISATGTLTNARREHTNTLLSDGRVLVAGGSSTRFSTSTLSSAEIYDPSTGLWSATGSLNTARTRHTATLLPNGNVLFIGGLNGSATSGLSSAEIFNPSTGTFSNTTGSLANGRYSHTATLLGDGSVLVAAGIGSVALVRSSTERYSPASGSFVAGPMMNGPRDSATATLLPDGRVMVAGGLLPPVTEVAVAYPTLTVDVFDPSSNSWSLTDPLLRGRVRHTTLLLPEGDVLILGNDPSSNVADSFAVDRYSITPTATWATGGALSNARSQHTANLLHDGRVLIVGGAAAVASGTGAALATAELYNPATHSSVATAPLANARYRHSATTLAYGRVLVAGGIGAAGSNDHLSSAQLFDPVSGVWIRAGSMGAARSGHTATLLADGNLLVVGGGTGYCEIYSAANNSWSGTAGLASGRTRHSATLLATGKVLVTGGRDGAGVPTLESYLFDPALGTWAAAASLPSERIGHTASLLPDGQVLVTGGVNGIGEALATSLRFDPVANIWTAADTLNTARSEHTATRLPDGSVVVVGGLNGTQRIDSAERFDVGGNRWIRLPDSLFDGRFQHATVLTAGGELLITGGVAPNNTLGVFTSAASVERLSLRPFATGVAPSPRASLDVVSSLSAATVASGGALAITGSGLRPAHDASGGTSMSSPTNLPVVQVMRIDNGQTRWILGDAALPVTNTTFSSSAAALAGFPQGPVLVTAFVNGIASTPTVRLVNDLSTRVPPAFTSAPISTNITFLAPYSITVTASGTPAPTFAVTSGELPTNLTLNPSTGVISGTPVVLATSTGDITSSNGFDPVVTQSFSITVQLARYTVTPIVTSGNGTAVASGGNIAIIDTRKDVILTADTGYYVTVATGAGQCNGALRGSAPNYYFEAGPITQDCAVTATFIRIPVGCARGTWSLTGVEPCTDAAPGYIVVNPNSTSELACLPGSYQPNSRQVSCLPAGAGFYVSGGAATTRIACLAGTYQPGVNGTSCRDATPGNFVAAPAAIAQTPCAAGSYSSGARATSCTLASVGFYVPFVGAFSQTACPVGSASTVTGATACVPFTFTVTPTAGTNGSVSPNVAQTVNYGATPAFTITAASGYTASVATGSGNCGGNLTGTAPNFSFTTGAVTANCAVAASFTVAPPQCAPGTYSFNGNAPCTQASVGFYVPSNGATVQIACVFGSTSNAGASACTRLPLLNIDDSDAPDVYSPNTDGTLLLRYLFGLRGTALTAGALGTNARRDAAQIVTHIETYITLFDVDGDGQTRALTDGVMILRRLLGLSGSPLTSGAKNSIRTDDAVRDAIDALKP
jgi:N-acetylneuraminic acid mutarotase